MTLEEQSAKSRETLDVIHRMEAALGAGSNDMAAHFHEDFLWLGNTGCGIKRGLAEFRANWQLPLRAAFSDRTYLTEEFLADGDWAACFGHIEATHSGPFMGMRTHGRTGAHPVHGFLAGRGWPDLRQPRFRRLRGSSCPAWPGRVRRRGMGSLRRRGKDAPAPGMRSTR